MLSIFNLISAICSLHQCSGKSPFEKGGFRGICLEAPSALRCNLGKIPPDPSVVRLSFCTMVRSS